MTRAISMMAGMIMPVITICALGVAGWNLRASKALKAQASFEASHLTKYKESLYANRSSSVRHGGRPLVWPSELVMVTGAPPATNDKSTLILVFDDHECTSCVQQESAFLERIARSTATMSVVAVVSAHSRQYVATYADTLGKAFAVAYDPTQAFAQANDILNGPTLLLAERGGTIVAADYPIAGEPSWTVPFRALVERIVAPQ